MTNLRWVTWLRRILVLVGAILALTGVWQAVGAASLPPSAPEQVPVRLDSAGYRYLDITVRHAPPGDPEWFALARKSTFMLDATGAGPVGHFLSRGDAFVYGLAALAIAVTIAPVLTSIAERRPFGRRNSRRLVAIALTIAVAGVAGPLLPRYEGVRALERTGLADLSEPAGPYFVLQPGIPLMPVLLAAVVLALAVAFRAGERLTADVEGLV